MNDKEIIIKLVEKVVDDYTADDFELLRWLMRKYEELGGNENV